MTAVDFLVATAVAMLAGLGVGSGGFLVIWLTLVKGMSQTAATGINLVFFTAASATALLRYEKRHMVVWRAALPLLCFGLVGTAIGTRLAHLLPADTLRAAFAAFLVLTGGYLLLKGNKKA